MSLVRNIEKYIKQNDFKITLRNKLIDIENYTKIDTINENEMIIINNNQKIIIKGKSLTINKMLNNELLITGNYNIIKLEGNNE